MGVRPTLLLVSLAGCVLLTPQDRAEHTDADGDGVPASRDCDDADAAVGRPSEEVCNAVDDDCDGEVDEGLSPDRDGDGFGDDDPDAEGCFVGWVAQGGDCDDRDPHAFPGAPERCDGVPNDCETAWSPDDELGVVTWVAQDGEAWEDWTTAFASGAPGAPALLTLPADGTLHVCRGIDAFAVRLTAADPDGLEVRGRGISSPDDAEAADAWPVLSGADGGAEPGPVLSVSGASARLQLRRLQLVGGQSTALQPGGGLSVRGGRDILVRDVVVANNLAAADAPGAAGVHAQFVERLALVDVEVRDNRTAAGGGGAGLFALGTDVRVDGAWFHHNEARGAGGGVYLDGSRLEAWDSAFEDNEGADGGGALFVSGGSDGYLYDTVFAGNVGDLGGAARVEGNLSCFAVREGPTFSDQVARYAGAVYAVLGAGRASFDGCTVGSNQVTPGRSAAAIDAPDLVVGASGTESPEDLHYRITGPWWFCELATGCYGDVAD